MGTLVDLAVLQPREGASAAFKLKNGNGELELDGSKTLRYAKLRLMDRVGIGVRVVTIH